MRPEVHAALQPDSPESPLAGTAITKPISRLFFSPQPISHPQASRPPPRLPSRSQPPPNGHGNGTAAAANGRASSTSQQQQQQQQQQGALNMSRGKSERTVGQARQQGPRPAQPSLDRSAAQSGNGPAHSRPGTGQLQYQPVPQNGGRALQARPGAGQGQNGITPLPSVQRQPVGNRGLFLKETPLKIPGGWSVQDTYSMWDFYCDHWRPFGELLTDMEREGFLVNRCIWASFFMLLAAGMRGDASAASRALPHRLTAAHGRHVQLHMTAGPILGVLLTCRQVRTPVAE